METVAIILARGGSKGIPGKNLRRVDSITLLSRAILAAKKSGICDQVVVSTDSLEITSEAVSAGAFVINRPSSLAEDLSPSEPAIEHAIIHLENSGFQPNLVLFIQPTSPFINPQDLVEAARKVSKGSFDSVFSARESYEFIWTYSETDQVVPLGHDVKLRLPRQRLRPKYIETGAFYVFHKAKFLDSQSRFSGRVGLQVVDSESAIDIDEFADLELAQLLAPKFRNYLL